MSAAAPTRLRAADGVGRAPLLVAAFVFSAGILFGTYYWRPLAWWLVLAVACAAGAVYLARRRPLIAYALALLLLAALGALDAQLRPSVAGDDLSPYMDGTPVTVTAHVVRDGMMREGDAEQRQSVDVETETIASGGAPQSMRARIRLNLYARGERDPDVDDENPAAAPARQFVYGDRLRFTAKLRPPHNYGNPGSFDYRAYLAERGITALASAGSAKVEPLDGFAGWRVLAWRSALRRRLLERIAALWSPRDAALLSAMLLGETALLDRSMRTEFQRTGVFHILVVSGMNVALLAAVVFWTLRRLRAHELLATALTMLACAGYAFLTEGDPPVTRAAIMIVIYLATRLLYRERAPRNALGAAALLILAWDPHALLEASFQLSFLAVLAIAGIALPLLARTSAPYRAALVWIDSIAYDQTLPPRMAQFRLDLRLVAGRLARFLGVQPAKWTLVLGARVLVFLFDVFLVSALMQVTLALPMAWYFHRALAVGLPANVFSTPLVAVLVPLAGLAAVVSLFSTAAAAPFAAPAAFLLDCMLRMLRFFGEFRAADLRVAMPTPGIAVAMAAAIAFALFAVRRGRTLAWAGMTALVASAVWIALVPPHPQLTRGVLEITAIDVGQGDALLVVTPEGKTLLIDGGGTMRTGSDFDIGEEVVSPYLWSRGITRLDAIALTHAHIDHVGGLPAVIANFRPRALWVGVNPPTEPMQALLAAADRYGVAVERHVEGDHFELGGMRVLVVSPAPGWQVTPKARNNDSLGLLVSYGGTAALLEGDAEKKIEKMIAGEEPQAELLKVGHHGSITSTTPELLAAVQPKLAVISVGYRSPFGHPRREVLERLEQAGALTHRTDLEGAVTFVLDGEVVRATPPSLR